MVFPVDLGFAVQGTGTVGPGLRTAAMDARLHSVYVRSRPDW